MGMERALCRGASLVASGSLVVAVSCLAPTEVTLVLTTDIPCGAQHGTSIAVGDADDIAASAPVTVTRDCTLMDADGGFDDAGALTVPASIGSVVVVPSGSRSASFTVQIVTAVDPVVQPGDCAAPEYQGCIVARRQLSFIAHTPLTLPIEMTLDCLNVLCSATETCYHAQCVTADAVCPAGTCTLAVSTPDASSSGDDHTTEEGGYDATPGMPVTDGSPEVGLQDAPIGDAPLEAGRDAAPEASIHDAATDVAAGASDAADASPPPSDGGIPSDASPLGSCIAAGPSSGVECAGGRCASGDVCCVTFYPGGGQTTEACTTLASCDYNGAGSTTYSALGCRNIGDCRSGEVCCGTESTDGSGAITQCATSCPYEPFGNQTTACQNSCECPASTPQCNAESCSGYTLGLCGATGGSTCL